DLYKSDSTVANGQGAIYLGSITADANGNISALLSVSGLMVGDSVTATATDAAGNTSEFSANRVVEHLNQPPIISVPTAQSLGENSSLTLSSLMGNAISITDDALSTASEAATLSITGGTLTLATASGLTFLSGNGSNLLNFSGPLTAIDAALDGLLYLPAQDFSGALTLSISVNDLGSSGAGGAQT